MIVVVDGQGGGIGAQIILKLREALPEDTQITALGANAIATANMLKAGANRGATGENAIRVTVPRASIITGPVSVIMANSMLGEITPAMAAAIASAPAEKVLLPLSQEQITLIGVSREPLPHLIEKLARHISGLLGLIAPGADG